MYGLGSKLQFTALSTTDRVAGRCGHWVSPSNGGSCLDFEQQSGNSQTRHAQQGHGRGDLMGAKALAHQIKVFQRFIHVGGIDTEFDNIAQIHARVCQNSFQIIQGKADLRAHIAGMLRVARAIRRGLACADHLTRRAVDQSQGFTAVRSKSQSPCFVLLESV